MPSPLEAAGATREPSEYATLSMDRHFTGLWTQRSPFRDADVPYLQTKFYQAARFDSMLDGINREVSARLTDVRRPGNSLWNTGAFDFPAGNSFYSWKFIQSGTEIIRVIYDGQDGNIYDASNNNAFDLFTKSAGAGAARFLGVNAELFFTDGVDNEKVVRSSIVWAATTAFTVGQFIIDYNLNIQVCTTPGTSGATQPGWATGLGATTADGSAIWTCHGSSVENWGIATPPSAPTVANTSAPSTYAAWVASTFYLGNNFLLDSNGNLELLYTSGSTNTTVPSWSVTPGGLTTDNTAVWLEYGTATRATSHAYHAAVATTLTNAIVSTGSQAATPASMANIYVGKVLVIDSGSSKEAVVVTAVTTSTFTANFTKTHAAGVAIAAPADTIAVNYHITVQIPGHGAQIIYFTDFFACTTPGTSSSSSTGSIAWQPGKGSQVNDGTATWTNAGPQIVWSGPITNPDGGITQKTLNPGGTHVLVTLVGQILDSNGNLENVTVPGLSGTVVPTWSTTLGGVVVDNGVTWTEAGPSPSSQQPGVWLYAYSYGNSVTGDIGTSSPESSPITLNANSFIAVQGVGSSDPQDDTIYIWRTAQGQSTLLGLATVPNPGGGNFWTYVDPGTPDTSLNAEMPAPVDHSNDPPLVGMTAPVWHCGRIFAIYQNKVVWSGGPDTITGNGNTAWPPLNFADAPEQPYRLFSAVTNLGPTLFVWGNSRLWAIYGTGTQANPFTPVTSYMEGVGVLSYNAVCLVGSTFYAFTPNNKFISLDPSAGYIEAGFPIGDQFELVTTGGILLALYDPAKTFVTFNEGSSGDTAIYVADGAVGWFRFSPVSSPESGYLWSPRAAIVGGTSCVQSVETSPGINQLLIAPSVSTGNGQIIFRDVTTNADWWNGEENLYPSWDVKGNIVLCQSGEVAEIAHIALKSMAVGSRPSVSLLLGEISATTAVPWDELEITSTDPPDLPPSQTVYSDRYSALQSGVTPKCDNFQLKVDYGEQNEPDELMMFSVYGAKHGERKQQ